MPALTSTRSISAFSSVTFTEVEIGRERSHTLGFETVQGSVVPPAVEGREPRDPDEVMVGTGTLCDLDASVGDLVRVRVGDRAERFRIVGRGVLPESWAPWT